MQSCHLVLIAALAAWLMPQPILANEPTVAKPAETAAVKLQVGSLSLTPEGFFPDNYTCRGLRLPPDLSLGRAPDKTKSLAIILEDPDALRGTVTHWIAYNIPAGTKSLTAGRPKADGKDIYLQGKNDMDKVNYIGPCPRPGTGVHRYIFKVYALDALLDLPAGAGKEDVKKALQGHILAEGELIGRYETK